MEEMISPDRKRLPYRMMNFPLIRLDNYYYVDKTRFIPLVEEADRFFFFIRPRRFGKSLTLNILQHYYDVRTGISSKPCLAASTSGSTLMQQGYITTELRTGFPAVGITNPDNFVSLLYYFGMLTISGTYRGDTKLTIPNQVVREQLYNYLLSTYNEVELNFNSSCSVMPHSALKSSYILMF